MAVKVSVIIPVFNAEKHLPQCLDSVLGQSLRDLEVICVDDGSTDGSPALLADYAARDGRVRVVTRARSTAGAARNAGLAVASGEYVGFVDADDFCDATLFEKAYGRACAESAELVLWRHSVHDARDGGTRPGRTFAETFRRETALLDYALAPWNRMVSRAFILREKLEFQDIPRANDVYFGCMTLMLAERVALLDEALYTYRVGTGTNLQATNARTPCTVVEAWTRLVSEWRARQIADVPARTVFSAAFASLAYTLESLSDVQAYGELWARVKAQQGPDGLFGDFDGEEIAGVRVREMWSDLRMSPDPVSYLVRQQRKTREQVSALWHACEQLKHELAACQKARVYNWREARRLEAELAALKSGEGER